MDILRDWIKKEGAAGRERILNALRAKFPGSYPSNLSSYIYGSRIPDKARAEIIAGVMGVPVDSLNYRHLHVPRDETLQSWIRKAGREGRQRLLAALKDEFPGIHSMSITNYLKPRGSKGSRIPNKERAEIMAEVMGVTLEKLAYRHLHVPDQK